MAKRFLDTALRTSSEWLRGEARALDRTCGASRDAHAHRAFLLATRRHPPSPGLLRYLAWTGDGARSSVPS
jgi:hypothetical protein